ncbi:acyl-CoA thioesterase [Vibrio sp. SCSIO 43136]|uniref:acyl-CoA thioesterase n=1 Tax=Vibrio sp. SCSIO 43136 TaxID=2819101 RepID=UPI002074D213|nr:acyl-CoA thioesterase [Vibrio sp. SCSIO 43136]USD66931.1 acyl-CoA thioesterase [Vibrio sp. SCSIO 43136]
MEDFKKQFSSVTEIKVAWGEMDALNHVNNAVYFRYFETARLDYFNRIELMEEMYDTQVGPVLGATDAKYILPVTYPDTLLVGTNVIDLQDDRFTMEYQVFSQQQSKVTTVGHATVVMFDFKTKKKGLLSERLTKCISELSPKSTTK